MQLQGFTPIHSSELDAWQSSVITQ